MNKNNRIGAFGTTGPKKRSEPRNFRELVLWSHSSTGINSRYAPPAAPLVGSTGKRRTKGRTSSSRMRCHLHWPCGKVDERRCESHRFFKVGELIGLSISCLQIKMFCRLPWGKMLDLVGCSAARHGTGKPAHRLSLS